ncbi:hypothetical protein CC78DRAFT_622261, partial [Lojkania enalia]
MLMHSAVGFERCMAVGATVLSSMAGQMVGTCGAGDFRILETRLSETDDVGDGRVLSGMRCVVECCASGSGRGEVMRCGGMAVRRCGGVGGDWSMHWRKRQLMLWNKRTLA